MFSKLRKKTRIKVENVKKINQQISRTMKSKQNENRLSLCVNLQLAKFNGKN